MLSLSIIVAVAVRWRILALLHFYVRLTVAVGENGNVPKLWLGALAFLVEGSAVLESRGLVAYNGLRLKKVGDFEAEPLF